jgi:hypothetical protein
MRGRTKRAGRPGRHPHLLTNNPVMRRTRIDVSHVSTRSFRIHRSRTSRPYDPDFVGFNFVNRRYHYPSRSYLPFRAAFLQLDPLSYQYRLPDLWQGWHFEELPRFIRPLAEPPRPMLEFLETGRAGVWWNGVSLANDYSFAGNNPLMWQDPDGRQCGPGAPADGALDAPFGFDFSLCCLDHDWDYKSCKLTKDEADDKFWRCMRKVVRQSGKSRFKKFWGRRAAGFYYMMVRDWGWEAFCQGQRKAECCLHERCK